MGLGRYVDAKSKAGRFYGANGKSFYRPASTQPPIASNQKNQLNPPAQITINVPKFVGNLVILVLQRNIMLCLTRYTRFQLTDFDARFSKLPKLCFPTRFPGFAASFLAIHNRTSGILIYLPISRLPTSKHRSIGQRENATHSSHSTVIPSEPAAPAGFG